MRASPRGLGCLTFLCSFLLRILAVSTAGPVVTRESLQLLVVDSSQLRAGKVSNDVRDTRTHGGHTIVEQEIRLGVGSKLISETGEVVAFRQILGVESAAAKIGNVDAGECASLTKIATDIEELGVHCRSVLDVGKEVGLLVWVQHGAAIPVVRDLLVSRDPGVSTALAGN